MSQVLEAVEPREVWAHFEALNAVPRPSKKEERIIAFMQDFGKTLGLETSTDPVGNVLIRKPGSQGREGFSPVILQAHLDMVHQQNEGTGFDFDSEGIRMYVESGWVRAHGTTLGADNGLGVAAIMAVLAANDLEHPPIEALFTIDEETGMTGAKSLQPGWLKGTRLLNLDTEEDNVLTVGCAGGIDLTGSGNYKEVAVNPSSLGIFITVEGLKGGHSGMDIHKGLGNANKILARVLQECMEEVPLQLASFSGGNLRNAIPREAKALVALDKASREQFIKVFARLSETIKGEFAAVEPGLQIGWVSAELPEQAMAAEDAEQLLRVIRALLSGVYYMSYQFPEQTETSNNVARVEASGGQLEIGCLTRSSSESRKRDLLDSLSGILALAGYAIRTSGDYPGWQPAPDSKLLQLAAKRYQLLFNEEPKIEAGHGGLECGIIKNNYPDMDMISFGPDILGAHSPDERASISSTQKFWRFLKDLLAEIKD